MRCVFVIIVLCCAFLDTKNCCAEVAQKDSAVMLPALESAFNFKNAFIFYIDSVEILISKKCPEDFSGKCASDVLTASNLNSAIENTRILLLSSANPQDTARLAQDSEFTGNKSLSCNSRSNAFSKIMDVKQSCSEFYMHVAVSIIKRQGPPYSTRGIINQKGLDLIRALETGRYHLELKTDRIMKWLRDSAAVNPKYDPYYKKALQASKVHNEFTGYVKELSTMLEQKAGLDDSASIKFAHVEAKLLKVKINKARMDMIYLLSDENSRVSVNRASDLRAEDPENAGKKTWESETFEYSPLAGIVTILSKIRNDCLNTYSDVILALVDEIK